MSYRLIHFMGSDDTVSDAISNYSARNYMDVHTITEVGADRYMVLFKAVQGDHYA